MHNAKTEFNKKIVIVYVYGIMIVYGCVYIIERKQTSKVGVPCNKTL